MTVKVNQAPPVSITNPKDVVYISGNEITEGSLRIIPDTSFGTECEFQKRDNGVWNDTGILIAASTIYLGRELRLSAGGEFIFTRDVSESIRSLVPHVRYNDLDGSSSFITVPELGALIEDFVIQSDSSGEISGSIITYVGAGIGEDALITTTNFLTTSAATGPVTLSIYRGLVISPENIFYKRTFAASDFPEDTNITLTTDGLVEVLQGDLITVVLECEEGGTVSLAADSTNTFPFQAVNYYPLTEFEFGYKNVMPVIFDLVVDEKGNFVQDEQEDYVYAGDTLVQDGAYRDLRVTWSSSTNTNTLTPNELYRYYSYTGSGGDTLTLSNESRDLCTSSKPWEFVIKDESGVAGSSPIIIDPNGNNLDGSSSTVSISIDYGVVRLYCNGNNYYSL